MPERYIDGVVSSNLIDGSGNADVLDRRSPPRDELTSNDPPHIAITCPVEGYVRIRWRTPLA
jgi:hypothetical protein